MKKIFILLSFCFLLFHKSYTQQLDHILGDLLIQCVPGTSIEQISPKIYQFDGKSTNLSFKKQPSAPLNIWLVSFDYNRIHERDFLAYVQNLPGVINAQFNHLVSLRQTIPNDPSFASQWQWLNLGSQTMTADADVDAELAWDITKGGMTPEGDEIVIVVLDDGIELTHPDLTDNLWVNSGEIPGNGLDDDQNLYIDDYNGWNINTQDDDVSGGDHGVEVAGMIGAKGNNMTGLTGINWNVKIMTVKLNTSGLTEAEILEAYTYPLRMRQLYNQSGGSQGAFIVASNSSWGLDGGDPSEAPLWCAMYDSLGQAGIINCAATTNSNSNVDINGDLPTTCPGDYLIAVASTDANDQLQGGFGPVNVDLAAPGIGVWTTSRSGGYRSVIGTSYASPVVAGIAGLMYSAPCSNLTRLAKESPGAAARLIRNYLMQSVDKVDPLTGIVASEGRVNAFNALQAVLADCGTCPTPLALQVDSILDISVSLNWFAADVTLQNTLRWRKIGDPTWNQINNISSPYRLGGLVACMDYEWQIQSVCPGETSDFSAINQFTTEGCCVPPASLQLSEITDVSALASWPSVFAAQSYNLRIREGGGNWSEFSTTDLSFPLNNLSPCTLYETQVQTVCVTGITTFTNIISFQTKGCGNCIDLSYCISEGNDSQSEWIERVALQNLDNTSGNNGGYLFTNSTNVVLEAGASYPIILRPGYSGSAFTESFRVWIDFNQNGDFEDADEQVYEALSVNTEVFGLVNVPVGAQGGSTRMRVSMKFNASSTACEDIDFGEVEDYCIEISASNGCFPPTASVSSADPAPAVNIAITNPPDQVSSFNLRFRKTGGTNWTQISDLPGSTTEYIITEGLDICAAYELQLQSVCGSDVSSWSSSFNFSTLGCGACLDLTYCESRGNSASFEHLQRVQINTLNNDSGNNGGYGDFTGTAFTTELKAGNAYDLTLTPFYPFDPFDVVYSVWIDYNQDGNFEEVSDKVFESALLKTAITQSILIPASAPSGLTRMRISMRENDPAEVCAVYPFGETEDYCVLIINEQDCLAPEISIDSITKSSVSLSWDSPANALSFEGSYRITGQPDWTSFTTDENSYILNSLDSCEEYETRIRSLCSGSNESTYSSSVLFITDCTTAISPLETLIRTVRVYPNPFTDFLFIEVELTAATSLEINLFGVGGKLLMQETRERRSAGKQVVKLDQSADWPAGVYYIQLLTDQGQITKKVVKF